MKSFAAFSLGLAAFCNAHISLNPSVSSGSYTQSNVRVPHGCNTTSTVGIRVTIPEGVSSVKAQRVSGWTLVYTKRPLPVPIVSEGVNLTEEIDTVSWTDGNLPDNGFDF